MEMERERDECLLMGNHFHPLIVFLLQHRDWARGWRLPCHPFANLVTHSPLVLRDIVRVGHCPRGNNFSTITACFCPPYTTIYYYILLYTTIYYYILLYTTIYYYILLYTTICYNILLYTTIYYYILLYTTTAIVLVDLLLFLGV